MAETIRGQVEEVRVLREGWGTITVLYGSARERAKVTGHPLGIEPGDTVEVVGSWTEHARYGRQFRAKSVQVVAPSDAAGAIEWILSRLPGVGRKRATAMLERWPLPELWTVLGERPDELVAIAGVTPKMAERIGRAYTEHLGERDRIVALRGWGLSDRQAARVIQRWGERALEVLRADPYLLAQEIEGFGFKRSDAVALKMGLPLEHPSRVRAGLEHMLDEAAGAGHTYVPAGKLISMTARDLGVDESIVLREGREAIAAGRMVQRDARGGQSVRVYAPRFDEAEQSVADAIRRLTGRARSSAEANEGSEAA